MRYAGSEIGAVSADNFNRLRRSGVRVPLPLPS